MTNGSQGKLFYLLSASLALLALPGHASANDQVHYQPAPNWVLPAPPADPLGAGASPPVWRTFDIQERIEGGQLWEYVHGAVKVASPEQLTKAGTLTLVWSPDHGDLMVHAVTILRAGKAIDALASGAKFEVLRREQQLEARELNGQLSATLQVEGLQVGDVLETAYSVTLRDPALRGHAGAHAMLLAEPTRVGFGRVRVLWRKDDKQHWKTYLDGVNPTEADNGDWHELTVHLPVGKQPDQAPQAPGRFARPPLLETSDFADWGDVSRTMAPLYRTDSATTAIAPDSDLGKAIAAIAAATADPRQRTAMALQLVQDKVRYFAVSMNGGNLVPQTPQQTWAKRYGDCKAKTLLLLVILHKLGVEAEPALADLQNGDLVQSRLPSVAAFNHIFVLAHVGGQTLWLDGTGMGTRLADLDDVAPYHWVLPVRSDGAELLQAPPKVPARPQVEFQFEDDMRGGLTILAPRHVRMVLRGAAAGQIDAQIANLDAEARADQLRKLLQAARIAGIFLRPQFSYDLASGTATITADGMVTWQWKHADSRYSFDPGFVLKASYPDRSRTIWQTIPLALNNPTHYVTVETIKLPHDGQGLGMEGAANDPYLDGSSIRAELVGGEWHYTLTFLDDGSELAAAKLPERRRLQGEFFAKAPKLRSAANYPAAWQGVEAAKRDHLYDRTNTMLDQWIAEKPDDPQRYFERAMFHASIFERDKAIADLTRLLALKADKVFYRDRAAVYQTIGRKTDALNDLKAALDLDPSDLATMARLTQLLGQTGAKDDALARLDTASAGGGDNEAAYLAMKADVLANNGDADGALAAIDAALEKRSGDAQFLNSRCWIKALLNVDLDSAAADCSRAIQLSEAVAPGALDSRALVRFRQHDLVQAVADLDAALDLHPYEAGSHFLRALAEREAGKMDAAQTDRAAALYLNPSVEDDYARFGLRWQPGNRH
jgi:tetratricopeptide (TPR) repeat protein